MPSHHVSNVVLLTLGASPLVRSLGDRSALEALVRFADEEMKHQQLFRSIGALIAEGMPIGYRFVPRTADVAEFVLGKSTWAVLALTCLIELFTHLAEAVCGAGDKDACDPAILAEVGGRSACAAVNRD